MQICCKPAGLEDKGPKTESGFSPKIMQIRCKTAGLEDKGPKPESGFCPKIMQICCKTMQIRCKPAGLEDKGSRLNLDLIQKSCKYAANQLVWRIRIPKLNVNSVPKSCKNNQNQVLWRIRIRKVRFPKLILQRGLDAFVDTRLILFFEGSGSANWI